MIADFGIEKSSEGRCTGQIRQTQIRQNLKDRTFCHGTPALHDGLLYVPTSSFEEIGEIEEALDIEYAHGIAPGANIILVEANSDSDTDLFAACAMAANLPGVSAISMSWGENEFSSQILHDDVFLTPSGHAGVTFLAVTNPDRPGPENETPSVTRRPDSPAGLRAERDSRLRRRTGGPRHRHRPRHLRQHA